MSTSTGTKDTASPDHEDEGAPRVSEQEARQVAEEAREHTWRRPSFAKELYLGRFDLDLVHPHPRPEPEDEARGEAFLERLREVTSTMDGARIERDARIPDEDIRALADIGTFGMKIPTEYGGLGLTMQSYARALVLIGSVHPSLGAHDLGPPVDRRPGAGQARRDPRAEGTLPSPVRRRCHLGVPAHRAGRRVGPGPHGDARRR